jgi:hypothetical protein
MLACTTPAAGSSSYSKVVLSMSHTVVYSNTVVTADKMEILGNYSWKLKW